MTGNVPERPEGYGAQEGDEKHGEVPGIRAMLRRVLPVPGSVVPSRGVVPGGGGMGWRIGH